MIFIRQAEGAYLLGACGTVFINKEIVEQNQEYPGIV